MSNRLLPVFLFLVSLLSLTAQAMKYNCDISLCVTPKGEGPFGIECPKDSIQKFNETIEVTDKRTQVFARNNFSQDIAIFLTVKGSSSTDNFQTELLLLNKTQSELYGNSSYTHSVGMKKFTDTYGSRLFVDGKPLWVSMINSCAAQ